MSFLCKKLEEFLIGLKQYKKHKLSDNLTIKDSKSSNKRSLMEKMNEIKVFNQEKENYV